MPRVRHRAKERFRELTWEQQLELELGPDDFRPQFRSALTRRAAWFMHRDTLMQSANAGVRPWGFWEFEAKEERQEGEPEVLALDRMGLLGDEEVAEVLAEESLLPESMQHLTRRRRCEAT